MMTLAEQLHKIFDSIETLAIKHKHKKKSKEGIIRKEIQHTHTVSTTRRRYENIYAPSISRQYIRPLENNHAILLNEALGERFYKPPINNDQSVFCFMCWRLAK